MRITLEPATALRPAASAASPSVLLVDDHPLYREALADLLRRACDEPLDIAHADSAEAALQLAAVHPRMGLVVIDLNLPGTDGAEAIAALRRDLPRATLIVVSGSEARHDILAALRAGAQAFVSKAVMPHIMLNTLRRALRARLNGPEVITRNAQAGHELSVTPTLSLTDRQLEVLTLIGKGHPNKEIALRLGLAEITIKQHVSRILSALGVSNRTQAAITARRMALTGTAGDEQVDFACA